MTSDLFKNDVRPGHADSTREKEVHFLKRLAIHRTFYKSMGSLSLMRKISEIKASFFAEEPMRSTQVFQWSTNIAARSLDPVMSSSDYDGTIFRSGVRYW